MLLLAGICTHRVQMMPLGDCFMLTSEKEMEKVKLIIYKLNQPP